MFNFNMISQNYLAEIKTQLNSNKLIENIEIVKERAIPDQGYFRARLTLNNGDFLEVAEFFKVENGQCITVTYSYQWMNSSQSQ
jgi:glucan biosynthesis protein